MEVRDLWPESIAAVGAMNKGRVYRASGTTRVDDLYKSASKLSS